ncbi:unnamed protein product, partial [Musa acuminata subsp. malaccensis]
WPSSRLECHRVHLRHLLQRYPRLYHLRRIAVAPPHPHLRSKHHLHHLAADPATPTSEESATATNSPQPPATPTSEESATTTAKKDGPASAEAATATAASGTRPPSTTGAAATEPEPHRHHRRVRLPRRPSPPRMPRGGTVLLHQEEKEEDGVRRGRGGPCECPRDCRSRTPWPTTGDPVDRRRYQSP